MNTAHIAEKAARIEAVIFDMAGTTVTDDGVVEKAFQRAAERTGVADEMGWEAALDWVRATMGRSKIEVFTHIAGGDRSAAERATAAFEDAYAEVVREEGVSEIAGSTDIFRELRSRGTRVVLTTGFAPVTRDAIISALEWEDEIDLALSPVDAGRGRPSPDMPLTAIVRLGLSATQSLLTIGDTTSDIECGRRAGAGIVCGVTSGAHAQEALTEAGADIVFDSVMGLREILLRVE